MEKLSFVLPDGLPSDCPKMKRFLLVLAHLQHRWHLKPFEPTHVGIQENPIARYRNDLCVFRIEVEDDTGTTDLLVYDHKAVYVNEKINGFDFEKAVKAFLAAS